MQQIFEEEIERYGKSIFDDNNKVIISGVLKEKPTVYSKDQYKIFYKSMIEVKRNRDASSSIEISIPKSHLVELEQPVGKKVQMKGCIRSTFEGENLQLFLFPKSIYIAEEPKNWTDDNYVFLRGTICKQVEYKRTNKKDPLAKVFLRVKRNFNYFDYITCSAWYENAESISKLQVGDKIELYGNIEVINYERLNRVTGQISTNPLYKVCIQSYQVCDM